MSIIEPKKLNIGDLFSLRTPFSIPSHQRTYSWTDDEVNNFCEDLRAFMPRAESQQYFFGGIVTIQQTAGNLPGRKFIVIDGQQRLATFAITIAQIRNGYKAISAQAEAHSDVDAARAATDHCSLIEDEYLYYKDDSGGRIEKRNRLTLSDFDKEFFSQLLSVSPPNVDPVNKSHRLLKNAYDNIAKELIAPIIDSEKSFDDKRLELKKLQDIFLERCVIINILCDDAEDAFQLFEVLNDRGRDLATCDYLRNFSMQQLSSDSSLVNRAAKVWDTVAENDQAGLFLKHYLKSHIGALSGRLLHKSIREHLFRNDNASLPAADLVTKIEHLGGNLRLFQNIIDDRWPVNDGQANDWAKSILVMLVNNMKHKLCIPLVLAILDKQGEALLASIIPMLGRVTLRYSNICGQRANRLDTIYNKWIGQLRTEPSTFSLEACRVDLNTLIDKTASDAVFESRLDEINYDGDSADIRMLLATLEHYHSWYIRGATGELVPDQTAVLNLAALHLDHIYPKKVRETDRDAKLEEVKHNLWNLTLFRDEDNREALNNLYPVKRDYYKQSKIILTRQLGESVENWDKQQFKNRKTEILKMAKKICRA